MSGHNSKDLKPKCDLRTDMPASAENDAANYRSSGKSAPAEIDTASYRSSGKSTPAEIDTASYRSSGKSTPAEGNSEPAKNCHEIDPAIREITPIAYIHTPFVTKFGIPRQSGLANARAEIHFEPEYSSPEAFRGIEEYSHLWLIWGFSENVGKWSPTVRPPRLGGNVRMGVFATRSPFRPNNLGLSSVQLERVEFRKGGGAILHVLGADLMDGTPIYDVKPYVPYVDSKPNAAGGFTDYTVWQELEVILPPDLVMPNDPSMPEERKVELIEILKLDPRPSYQNDPDRIYGLSFASWEVRFRVCDTQLTVLSITNRESLLRQTSRPGCLSEKKLPGAPIRQATW